jgi:penicillin-binding protein 2
LVAARLNSSARVLKGQAMNWLGQNSRFDSYQEQHQAVTRVRILQALTVALFLSCLGRLWWLQVANHDSFAVQAEQNRVRLLPIPAPRGRIYDRHGKVLADNHPVWNIVVSHQDIQRVRSESELIARRLGLEQDWLERRLEEAKYEPKYEAIVLKEAGTSEDVAWVMAYQYERPELRVETAPQRRYPHGTLAAHLLGYVGEVSRRELETGPFSRAQGYKLGDLVGKSGVERTYNEILTGRPGQRIVIVDSRGRLKDEVERVEPIPGRDLYTTLDFAVQATAEAQADQMVKGRGAIAALDPNNGEILALVSRPAFDPNVFSARARTPEGRAEISDLYIHEDRPLFNRVVQGTYPTGSTWKIFMAVAALNEGVITVEDSRLPDGGLQIGNYFMSSLSHLGRPDIHLAIVKSADGYFYRLGLKMGIEQIEKWTQVFRLGQRTGIDLPNERAGIPPSRAWKARVNPRDPQWRAYDTAAASIGQGIAITPLQMLRLTAGVAAGGQMTTPHCFLRSTPGDDRNGVWQEEIQYVDEGQFSVSISPTIHQTIKQAMWGVVNENGTGGRARVEGFDVSGKTGTAQVASKQRAGEKYKDHAWFVSFAPRDKPEIAAVVLCENCGFGGTHAAPKAQALYQTWFERTRALADTELVRNAPPVPLNPETPANVPEQAEKGMFEALRVYR